MQVNNTLEKIIAPLSAVFIFIILTALLYKDFLFHMDTKLLFDHGDPVLNLYFLKWGADYILGNLNIISESIFNLPVAFPFQNSLAFSDNLFGNQLVFLPYYILIDNPLLGFNLWILTTYFLNYSLMYYYLKNSRFIGATHNSLVPIMGASIFTFSIPSFDLLGGHFQLIPLYFIPISLILLEKLMVSLKVKYFILFGLAISFQFYLGIQTGFILLVLLMLLVPVYYAYLLNNQILFFKRIWISAVAFVVPTIILLIPYLNTSKLTGHRTYSDVLNYMPSISNFFSTNIGEKAIFVGFPVFLLFVLAILFMHIRKSKILLGIVILSFLFFLKEPHIFKLFFTYFPGFDSIRTPGRFIFVSITAIAIFVSVVMSDVEFKKLKYIFLVFTVGLATSLYQKNVPSMPYKYFDKPTPPKVLKILNHEPTLILPLYLFKNPDVLDIIDRMKNSDMQFPILDIYSGFNPTFVSELEGQYVHELNTLNESEKFIERIMKLGFQHILIKKEKIVQNNIIEVLNKEKQFQKVYEDSKLILFSCNNSKKIFLSLNEALKNVPWSFEMKSLRSEKNKTIFIGQVTGQKLSGVVQKKEQIATDVNINGKVYPCQLQLDKIKDSFSTFECISEQSYPEFSPMDRALKNPKAKYEIEELYNDEAHTVKLKITNIGAETWLAGHNGKYGLALSYMLENQKNGIKTGYDNRFYLPHNIKPGESFEITIPIKKLYSGENIITISMVQELVAWFHDRGNAPLSIKIEKKGTYKNE